MALNSYALCPCGSGKKLKFCECATESAELEKVFTAIDGDQRVAALDLIERVLEQKPQQKAMLAMKALVEMQLENVEAFRRTSDRFLAIAPENPTALTLAAYADLSRQKSAEALAKIHQSLAISPQQVNQYLPDALFQLASELLLQEKVVAARAHLMLLFSMMGEKMEHRQAEELFFRLERAAELPLVLRQDFPPKPCDPAAAYAAEFQAALDTAETGCWVNAKNQFAALDKRFPKQGPILFNLAVFQSYLADPQALTIWRKYAVLPELPEEDAVEAELLAQELDPAARSESIDRIRIIYAVKDVSTLLEILVSDRRVTRMATDVRELVPEGSPPPRGAFHLLDREPPAAGTELTREQIPVVIGDLLLFGKETDREARLEFFIERSASMVDKVRRLQDVGGSQLGMIEKEEKMGSVSALEHSLVTRWRMPEDVTPEVRDRLLREQQRHNMFEVLPQIPLALFGGKSAREISADPAYRLRLLALIRSYELQSRQQGRDLDFNELRSQLGLPALVALDPTGVDFSMVSNARLARFDTTQLTDEQLANILVRGERLQHIEALLKAAQELLNRPEAGLVKRSDALGILARYERDIEKACDLIQQAQDTAKAEGRSPAMHLLTELQFRIARMDAPRMSQIMQTLQSQHLKEPGVADAYFGLLVRFGFINPDGTPRYGAGGGPQPPSREPSPAANPANLWTGDAPSPAGNSGSKLWLPGME